VRLFNLEVRTSNASLCILFDLNLYIEVSKTDEHADVAGVVALENDYLQ
jgi:hypothetical protein